VLRGLEDMPQTIGAKCFGCGLVIRVPSNLGGRSAKCPKCSNIITIPTPADSQMDIVGDDQLPEVAKVGQIEDGELVEELPPPGPPPPVEAPAKEDSTRLRRGSWRSLPAAPRGGAGRGARDSREGSTRRPASQGSNTGLLVGGVIGAVALIVVLVVAFGGGSKSEGGKANANKPAKTESTEKAPNPEEQDLCRRCRAYFGAVNSSNIDKILDFYAFDDDKQKMKIKPTYSDKIREYVKPEITQASVTGETGATTFRCDLKLKDAWKGDVTEEKGKEFSLSCKKVNGEWKIVP
jgi:hypothetical protein